MTFRVRSADRGRAERDPNRRTLYMNIGFGIAVVLAVVILVAVGISTWYGGHLAPAATVNGQTITMDDFNQRAAVETFRLNQQGSRIQSEVAAGRMTQSDATSKVNALTSELDSSTFISTTLDKLIDTKLQASLASQLGVTVTDQQVDQAIVADKTRPEERHVSLISVTPAVDTGKTDPTDAQKAAAKQKADAALAQIKAGTKFEDVAKSVSDDVSKANGGDLGWIDPTSSDDAAWRDAMFKLPVNGVSDVIQGADGIYRIGRVTEIAPAEVDPSWDQKLAAANISQDAYRAAIRSEVLRQALNDKIVADDSVVGPQKDVAELYIQEPTTTLGSKAIKVRHILYSPNGDAQNASSVPATDPSWEVAHQKALATYTRLQQDPQLFDQIARSESDEGSANGPTGTGGKLPYFGTGSSVDDAFLKAITAPGLTEGQILEPVKSAFGWHVIQVMYRPTDQAHMEKIKTQADGGKDFGVLARDESYGTSAGSGGDLGWIIKGQLDDKLTDAIWATPVGQTSAIVNLTDAANSNDDGLYLFKVFAEETRAPEGRQLDNLKQTAFSKWYTAKKAAATIERSESIAPTN